MFSCDDYVKFWECHSNAIYLWPSLWVLIFCPCVLSNWHCVLSVPLHGYIPFSFIWYTDPFPSLLVTSDNGLMHLDLLTHQSTPLVSGNVDKVDVLYAENVRLNSLCYVSTSRVVHVLRVLWAVVPKRYIACHRLWCLLKLDTVILSVELFNVFMTMYIHTHLVASMKHEPFR